MDAYGGYTHLATPKRTGGAPLRLAFCWVHGRRKLTKPKPQKGSPIVDAALLRIAALAKSRMPSAGLIPIIVEPCVKSCPARWWTNSSPG